MGDMSGRGEHGELSSRAVNPKIIWGGPVRSTGVGSQVRDEGAAKRRLRSSGRGFGGRSPPTGSRGRAPGGGQGAKPPENFEKMGQISLILAF